MPPKLFLRRWKYTLTGLGLLVAGPFVLGLVLMLGFDWIRAALVPSLLPVGYWRAVLLASVFWVVPASLLVTSVILGIRKR